MSTMQEASFLWNHLTKYTSMIMTKDIIDGGKRTIPLLWPLLLITAFRDLRILIYHSYSIFLCSFRFLDNQGGSGQGHERGRILNSIQSSLVFKSRPKFV